jgi:6-hydroxycyclohex-1-ene-1-carbonyl-CoA dehydrogenase
MEAVQLVEAGSLELREVPKPDPGADEVRVAGCGVCHTDIGFWKEGVATRKGLPLTLGHEISGVVESAGASFSDLVGREVIVPAVIPCGECELCRNGRGNVCRTQLMPGNDMDGGFADYVQVPGRGLCVVEDRGGYELAELSVIADAVTTPYQAVLRSGLQPGDLAVVVGVGGVGTYAVQIAATFDAKVIAIDVDASKLAAVADHGASLTIDASDMEVKDIRKQVTAAAKEWGSRLHSWKIYECSGNLKGQETAFGLLTHAATLMVVGFTLARGEFRLSNLMAFDATAQGTWGCRPELYPDALKMITDGQIALRPFIETHPLSEGLDVLDRVAAHEVAGRAILVPGLTA